MKTTFAALALASLAVAAPTAKSVVVNGVSATISIGGAAQDFSCSSGGSLTYKIETEPWNGVSLQTAQGRLTDWAAVAPGNRIASTGSSYPGSTRTWMSNEGSLNEVGQQVDTLTAVIPPSQGNSNLRQQWKTGEVEYFGGDLTLYESWSDLTVQGDANGQVTLQYFVNACASDQGKAYSALDMLLQDSLSSWISICQA